MWGNSLPFLLCCHGSLLDPIQNTSSEREWVCINVHRTGIETVSDTSSPAVCLWKITSITHNMSRASFYSRGASFTLNKKGKILTMFCLIYSNGFQYIEIFHVLICRLGLSRNKKHLDRKIENRKCWMTDFNCWRVQNQRGLFLAIHLLSQTNWKKKGWMNNELFLK